MFAQLSTFSRSLLYVGFQTLGAAIAGFLLRASLDTRSVSDLYPIATPCMSSLAVAAYTTHFPPVRRTRLLHRH
jgi:hypothetical protein